MNSECFDLRTTRFRLVNELTRRKATAQADPWELVAVGKAGEISPYGGDFLIASTRHSATTKRILAAVPEAVVTQDGGDGQNIKFPAAALETVARVLGLRKRRVLSEVQRARAAEVLHQHRFASHAVQVNEIDPGATIGTTGEGSGIAA